MQFQVLSDTPWAKFLVSAAGSGDTAPWWGVPVIAGTFLVVGAALGFWFNWLLEGRKQSRLESLRWDADIRLLSAELLGAVRECVRERLRRDAFTAGHAWSMRSELEKKTKDKVDPAPEDAESVDDHIRRETHFRRYDAPIYKESEQQSRAAWERIESLTAGLGLIAPEPIWAAADTLLDTLSRGLSADDDYDLPLEARRAISDERDNLVNAVRQHLRLPVFRRPAKALDLA